MLQVIRDRITGPIAVIILAVIAVTFIFFGVNMNFISSGYLAKVNGQPVSPNEVRETYQSQALQFRQQLGALPPALDQQLQRNALEQVILATAVDVYLRDGGYRVGDAMLRDAIAEIPLFQQDGKFSQTVYRDELALRGMVPAQFEIDQRKSMRIQQLQSAVAGSAFVTPADLRRQIELTNETRAFSYAALELSAFESDAVPADDEIDVFYNENSALFETEASATLEYVELTRDSVASNLQLDDEALTAYYESIADSFRSPEERNPRHILISLDDDTDAARSLAQSLFDRVQAGEDFEALAKEFSRDAGSGARGGDLGWVRRGQFVGPVDDAVFAMSEGELRGPVESEFGLHILRLDGIRPEAVQPFDEVRDRVEQQYRNDLAGQQFIEISNEFADQLFDDPNLGSLAASQGLELQRLENFTEADIGLFAGNSAVTDAVFGDNAIRGDSLSDVIQIEDGHLVVLRVAEFRPAALRALDEVRDDIVAQIRRDRAETALQAAAEALLASARSSRSLKQAAEAANAAYTDVQSVGRTGGELPRALQQALFSASSPGADGAVYQSVSTVDGRQIVFELTKVTPGRATEMSVSDRDSRRRQLTQQTGNSDFGAMVADIRENAEVVMGSATVFGNDDNF